MKNLPEYLVIVLIMVIIVWSFPSDAQVPFGGAKDTQLNQWVNIVSERLAAQGARISTLELRVKELEGREQSNIQSNNLLYHPNSQTLETHQHDIPWQNPVFK